MRRVSKQILFMAAATFTALPLLSQTSSFQKPTFEVISIKPAAPIGRGEAYIGGGPRGDRYTMRSATLRMLLQDAYHPSTTTTVPAIQIIGAPSWIDSDRYDIQATANCGGGVLSREQVQLMIRSMLEERFQLKAHVETREAQVYNLVVAKSPPKIKLSDDQTPISRPAFTPIQPCSPAPQPPANPPAPLPGPGQRGNPFDPNNSAPRGFLGMLFGPAGITLRGSAATISDMIDRLQIYVGGRIVDKTDLKGMFDFTLQFGPEGLVNPDGRPMAPTGPPIAAPGTVPGVATAPDPAPTLFTAIQELGLKLEPARGPVEMLVVDSVQKPTEN